MTARPAGEQHSWYPIAQLDHIYRWLVSSSPLDHESEFARLLGIALERWSILEAELCRSLEHLLDGNGAAAKAMFYTLNSLNTRLNVIRSIAVATIPEGPEKSGFLTLIQKAQRLNKKRNDFVHAHYHTGVQGLDRLLIRPATKEPRRWQTIGTNELHRHIEAVERLEISLVMANAENSAFWVPNHPSRYR